jgi:L-iditol 2-dehydrogenase
MIAEHPAETMLAAVLHGKEDLRIERIPIPHAQLKPPIVFGHELAGTITELGPGVTRFALGDRILPMNSAPCDACYFCTRNQQNLCENILFNNGAYAEYMRIPARILEKNTFLVPAGVPLEHAALTEPLACVVHGFNQASPQPGDTIAVIGAGPIGLMFLHVAQLHGLRVVAIVKRDDQVAAARHFGAAEVVQITPGTDTTAAVRALTPEARGADIVIEAVATPATWEQAVAIVRKGGTVNFFGGPPAGTTVALDTNRLHYGDITLKASFHHTPAACASAFALICGGKFKAAEFITRIAPLTEIPDVFARMMTRSADHMTDIKTAVMPIHDQSNGYHPNGSHKSNGSHK